MVVAKLELDPFAYEFHEDPYPTYRVLRDDYPVHYNERLDFYALTRYDDVFEGLRDFKTFSSGRGIVLEMMGLGIDFQESLTEEPMILFLDPPYQQQLRRLLSQGFTPRRVAALEQEIRELSVGLVDVLAQRESGDIVADFAALVPMNVIFNMLGVPDEDRLKVRGWIDTSLERDPEPPYITDRAVEAAVSQTEYHRAMLVSHRSGECPVDHNLFRQLIDARLDEADGSTRRLSDGEIVGFVGLLGGAGNETTTKLVTNTLLLLHRNPEARRAVTDNPERIADAVEESLRLLSPTQYAARTTTAATTRHGVTIPAGSKVLLMMGAANRDERKFPHPDRFDIDRPGQDQHLSFGAGVHFCLGASLARLEARVAVEEFLLRFPDYEIDEAGLVRMHTVSNMHGYEHVPFAVSAAC